MYEHLTPEYIKADALADFHIAETREGSYTNTIISPLTYELWKVYQSLDAVVPIVYVDETSGIYIDKSAESYGIIRKPGAKAQASVMFFGVDGTVIQAGKVFLTTDSLQYTLDSEVIVSGGSGSGYLTAVEVGEKYNVPAEAIFKQLVNQSGIEQIECSEATGGADTETDAALVKRYDDYRRRPPTSGNVAHYEQWAVTVDGIGAAKIIPLWSGPGTVKVLVVGAHNQPVDGAIVSNCADYIESVRPIGATVTVLSAAGHAINIYAQIIIKPVADIEVVKTAFEAALTAYLESVAFEDYLVTYNRIGYILLDIPDVVNFLTLTVNGGTSDIVINADEVPVVGDIEVSE